jgi:hypothetical protein
MDLVLREVPNNLRLCNNTSLLLQNTVARYVALNELSLQGMIGSILSTYVM